MRSRPVSGRRHLLSHTFCLFLSSSTFYRLSSAFWCISRLLHSASYSQPFAVICLLPLASCTVPPSFCPFPREAAFCRFLPSASFCFCVDCRILPSATFCFCLILPPAFQFLLHSATSIPTSSFSSQRSTTYCRLLFLLPHAFCCLLPTSDVCRYQSSDALCFRGLLPPAFCHLLPTTPFFFLTSTAFYFQPPSAFLCVLAPPSFCRHFLFLPPFTALCFVPSSATYCPMSHSGLRRIRALPTSCCLLPPSAPRLLSSPAGFCFLPPFAFCHLLSAAFCLLRSLLPSAAFCSFLHFADCSSLPLLQPFAAFYILPPSPKCILLSYYRRLLPSVTNFPPSANFLLPSPLSHLQPPATYCRHLHSATSCRILPSVAFSLLSPSTFCQLMPTSAFCLLPLFTFRHILLLSAFSVLSLSAFSVLPLAAFCRVMLSAAVCCVLPYSFCRHLPSGFCPFCFLPSSATSPFCLLLFAALVYLPLSALFFKPPNAASSFLPIFAYCRLIPSTDFCFLLLLLSYSVYCGLCLYYRPP